jgi:hypothetical protein
MAHKTLSAELAGEPPVVIAMERRHAPDRRSNWRGGRRDTDWTNRPDGSLSRVTGRAATILPWRTWLKSR